MNDQIASAAEQHGAVSEEIQRNAISVNDMSKSSASLASETNNTSKQLEVLVEYVYQLVSRFKV